MLVNKNSIASEGETRVIKLKGRVTASQISTTVDVNGDGLTGNLTTGMGTSNYGRLFGRSVSEIKPDLLNPLNPFSMQSCLMPDGESGFQFLLEEFNGVLRIEGFRGAVFLKNESGTVCSERESCFDRETRSFSEGCAFTGDWLLKITGGIGGLKDASGFLTLKGDGTILLVDPTGNFAGFDGKFEGDITIPK